MGVSFRILGPLEVWEDGRELPLGPGRQRALLVLLLLHANELVSSDRLVEELWAGRPPASAQKVLQGYVSQLRRALPAEMIVTKGSGYLLAAGETDVAEFERLTGLAAEQEPGERARTLRQALALWRGRPLADVEYERWAQVEIARLEELRLAALEERVEAELELGRHAQLVPELEALASEQPLRERLRGQLMLALYRCGRQADALEVYRRGRRALVEQLGLEPGPILEQLEKQILTHDEALAAPPHRPLPSGTVTFPPLETAAHSRLSRRRLAGAAGAAALAAVAAAVVLGTRGGSTPATVAAVSADSVGIFDPATGRPTGQIPVGASPSAAAAGAGSIWVANVDAHSVSRIDPVKQVTIQTIPVGNGPAGIAFGGGFVWVTNGLDGTVMKIDPQIDQVVQTIGVGDGPAGVAVDARDVWVANSNDGTVSRIDLRTGKVRAKISVGQSAEGVAVGFGSVWVTSQSTGAVTRIDERSGSLVQTVGTGSGADAVAVGRQAVWIANRLDGTVTRIDPAADAVRATIPVGDGPNGIVAVDGAVWVSNELAGNFSRIDPVRDTVVQTVKTGNRPEGIVAESGSLFVAVRASGTGHRGGMLTVLTSSGNILNVDPALVYNPEEGQVIALTNDGLTGFRRVSGSAGTRLVPDLAVSLPAPTDDGRSYSFRLRPAIRYSTGALVRPQDFRRALERSLVLHGPGSAYFAGIVGARTCMAVPNKPCDLAQGIVTAPASNTVTFHLTSPDPDFPYKLALSSAFAVPAATPLHPRGALPATGPYEIASFDPKRGIRLVRNPRFREWSPAAQPSGFPDTILERFEGEGSQDARAAAVVRGSADLATNLAPLSPAVLSSVRTQHASLLKANPLDVTFFLVLNTRVPPFDGVRVRRALNFAVDRERLRDLTVGQVGQVTCQVLPPDFVGYRRYCPYTAHPSTSGVWSAPDLAQARRLVDASGTRGEAVTVWIPEWIHFGPAAGRYVVSVLDSLGYKARFRVAKKDPYRIEDKLHLQAGFSGWAPDFAAEPAAFIPPTLTCGAYNRVNSENHNTAEFCNRRIDNEITRAESLQTSDPAGASRLWAKIDRDITDQAPWVPFANWLKLEVVSARVRNYQYNLSLGTLLDQIWVR